MGGGMCGREFLQPRPLVAVADKNQRIVRRGHLLERREQLRRLLGRRELAGEEHDALARQAELGPQPLGRGRGGGIRGIEVRRVDGMRGEEKLLLRHAQRAKIIPVGRADIGDRRALAIEKPEQLAAQEGQGLVFPLLWSILVLVWLLGGIRDGGIALRWAKVDWFVLALFAWHTAMAAVACFQASPRPAINMGCEWLGLGLSYLLLRQLLRTELEARAATAALLASAVRGPVSLVPLLEEIEGWAIDYRDGRPERWKVMRHLHKYFGLKLERLFLGQVRGTARALRALGRDLDQLER